MDRFNDWPERHAAFIDTRRFVPFAWGSNDCALFAADHRLVITGVDHAEGMRTYDTEAGAAVLVANAGGMAGLASMLRERDKRLVQRADTVLAVIDGRETFGVSVGGGQWCAPGARGLVFRPMSDVLKVFE